jgi:hypothetical protein
MSETHDQAQEAAPSENVSEQFNIDDGAIDFDDPTPPESAINNPSQESGAMSDAAQSLAKGGALSAGQAEDGHDDKEKGPNDEEVYDGGSNVNEPNDASDEDHEEDNQGKEQDEQEAGAPEAPPDTTKKLPTKGKGWEKTESAHVPVAPIIGDVNNKNIMQGKRTRTQTIGQKTVPARAKPTVKKAFGKQEAAVAADDDDDDDEPAMHKKRGRPPKARPDDYLRSRRAAAPEPSSDNEAPRPKALSRRAKKHVAVPSDPASNSDDEVGSNATETDTDSEVEETLISVPQMTAEVIKLTKTSLHAAESYGRFLTQHFSNRHAERRKVKSALEEVGKRYGKRKRDEDESEEEKEGRSKGKGKAVKRSWGAGKGK